MKNNSADWLAALTTKGGLHFLARMAVVWFSHGQKPDCEGFIQTGAFYKCNAPTTTLSGRAAVKLKNPRGDSPVKL